MRGRLLPVLAKDPETKISQNEDKYA